MGIRAHMLLARRRRMLMWWMLLAIIGCYAFAAWMAGWAARLAPGRAGMHVVLFAGNQGERIEWYLRRLRRWSLRTGRDVRVTLVDCGSTDDTAAIAERFGRGAGAVDVVRPEELAAASGDAGPEAGGPGAAWSDDPGMVKASWRSLRWTVPSVDGTMLINLQDPADVARLP
jgi:hypothetical protein